MKQMIFNLADNTATFFDAFLGETNREVIYALNQKEESLFYIWGQKGVGKSYLQQAWIHAAKQAGLRTRVVYQATELEATDEREYDCIALSDVQNYSPEQQGILFTLFNYWRSTDTALLISATMPPLALPFREDIRTRLGLSLVYEVKPLQDNEKIHVLKSLAQSRQMYVNEEVYHYLLRHTSRDLDLLIYIITQLDNYAVRHGRKMTLALLKAFLQEENHEQFSHF